MERCVVIRQRDGLLTTGVLVLDVNGDLIGYTVGNPYNCCLDLNHLEEINIKMAEAIKRGQIFQECELQQLSRSKTKVNIFEEFGNASND